MVVLTDKKYILIYRFMQKFYVKIKKDKVEIDPKVFFLLLDISYVQEYSAYKKAVSENEISFSDLKDLAEKAGIPYPLFFASQRVINIQIKDKEKELYQKIPSKSEISLNFRGRMKPSDIELIVRDLARKQEFIKKRILPATKNNLFIGSVVKEMALGYTDKEIAGNIRKYFNINLDDLRKMSKNDALNYLFKKVEDRNILISLSSYHYMPQEISKDLYLSGFCVKDKKFPYIFINNRDGDENPKILEPSGRQIFTLLAMLVSIGMNKFILSMKNGEIKVSNKKKIYSIVGEILIPKNDLKGVAIKDIDDLKKYSTAFKVTPSMLIVRLRELNLISKPFADYCSSALKKEIEKKEKHYKTPKPATGYGKYNGDKFSREVILAHKQKKISQDETKNILFRRGKMNPLLLNEYIRKYS
jgi:Zn-dependent peptidase ImmA (M78 family)